MSTWEEYTKPKYKEALSRWNKETGGGDGTLPSFADYASAPWLAWVFCLDSEFDYVLASFSEGRVPKHLDSEGGWVDPTENGGDNVERKSVNKDNVKKALTSTINSLNGMTATLTSHLEFIAGAIKAKTELKTPAKEKKNLTSAYCLQKIAKIKSDQDMIEMDEDITPISKKKSVDHLIARKRKWLSRSFTVQSSDDEEEK
jgi:hypothetical protein